MSVHVSGVLLWINVLLQVLTQALMGLSPVFPTRTRLGR